MCGSNTTVMMLRAIWCKGSIRIVLPSKLIFSENNFWRVYNKLVLNFIHIIRIPIVSLWIKRIWSTVISLKNWSIWIPIVSDEMTLWNHRLNMWRLFWRIHHLIWRLRIDHVNAILWMRLTFWACTSRNLIACRISMKFVTSSIRMTQQTTVGAKRTWFSLLLKNFGFCWVIAVSYTHLTLPTKSLV